MAVLDVHVFKSISLFLSVQLIEQSLFEVDALYVKDLYQALIVSLVAQQMKECASCIANVMFLTNDIRWRPQVGHQVKDDILEAEIAIIV